MKQLTPTPGILSTPASRGDTVKGKVVVIAD
jgi:hypothetical protein